MKIIKLIEKFKGLQDCGSSVFILRHAEKPIVSNMGDDIANSITAKGAANSEALGAALKHFYPQLGFVRSSPVKRCVETANHMFFLDKKNYPDIVLDTVLGGDGAYVYDNKLAAQPFLECPSRIDVFIRAQQGESFAGMRDVAEGTKLLLDKVKDDLENSSAPSFYITHDCILALFVNGLTGQIVDEKNWFQYLDGICIRKDDGRIKLYWQDDCSEVIV